MLRGYGFIQFETEEEGRASVSAENGQVMKGQRIGEYESKMVFVMIVLCCSKKKVFFNSNFLFLNMI